MATFKKFEEIECWKEARELTRRVYEITNEPAFGQQFNELNALAFETSRMLSGLMKYLLASGYKGTKFKAQALDRT